MPLPDRHLPQRRRPLQLSITAAWFLLSGLTISAVSACIIIFWQVLSIDESFHSTSPTARFADVIGHAFLTFMGLTLILGSISIIAGMGLLKMKQWGLWLSMFLAIPSAFINFNILLSNFNLLIRPFNSPSFHLILIFLLACTNIAISTSIATYLFKIRKQF